MVANLAVKKVFKATKTKIFETNWWQYCKVRIATQSEMFET